MPDVEWSPGAPLWDAEQTMLDRAAAGAPTTWTDEPGDASDMTTWGKPRTIRAAVLRHLLTHDDWPVQEQGAWLSGVRIAGPLNLLYARLRCALDLERCYLDSPEPVGLSFATAPRLMFRGCWLSGLAADGVAVASDVSLAGSTVTGPVRLLNARIGGSLGLRRTTVSGADDDGDAVLGDGLHIDGGAFLDELAAAGAVRLVRAQVGTALECTRASITGADQRGWSLNAEGVRVGGNLLAQGLTTKGAVVLFNAAVAGSLRCDGAVLDGYDAGGNSFVADGLTGHSSVFLNEGFRATGSVRLSAATIAGQLTLRGAVLDGTPVALNLDRTSIGADVLLADELAAKGTMSLAGTRVGGTLTIRDAVLAGDTALDAGGAEVTHEFRWLPGHPVSGQVDLRRMKAGCLIDDLSADGGYWPPPGRLRLVGFSYDSLDDSAGSVYQRIAWLRRRYAPGARDVFTAQPYEHLAELYRKAGQTWEARQVAIARENDLRRYGDLNRPQRALNKTLDLLVRHGYDLRRAAIGLVLLYAAVFFTFLGAQHRTGTMVPSHDTTKPLATDTALHCQARYPCFYPVTYALDQVVPILDVQDADAWRPDGHQPWGWVYIATTVAGNVLGWAFSTLAVLGFTGIARKE